PTMLLHSAAHHAARKVHPERIRPKALGGLQILLRSCEVLCRVGIVKLVDFSFDYASRRERRARIELGGLLKPAQSFVQVLNIEAEIVQASVVRLGSSGGNRFAGTATQVQGSRNFARQRASKSAYCRRRIASRKFVHLCLCLQINYRSLDYEIFS